MDLRKRLNSIFQTQAIGNFSDVVRMAVVRFFSPQSLWSALVALALLANGCGSDAAAWPPPPRNQQEQRLIDSARRAVNQFDGWTEVAWVVERHEGQWRVQAWQILHPKAKGRMRCAPWAVRGITFDKQGKLLEYRNHL